MLETWLPLAAGSSRLERVQPAADVRRFEPLVSDLLVVALASDPERVLDELSAAGTVGEAVQRSGRSLTVRYQGELIELQVAAGDEYGTALFVATGPAAHVAEVRQRSAPRLAPRERDVYAGAGLSFIPPELRHDPEAIDAAAAGPLPELVTPDDIRGDFHMHTTYSDGRDSIADMAAACAALRYEYIAITDHSVSASASRTMTVEDLARQRDEIARVAERFPQMTILHGAEVDILPDGQLDFDDGVLEGLDVVIASLHDRAGQSGRQLTQRCLRAIHHPLVSIISHPANRLVGRRGDYDMDYERLYAAAAETGTVLEIDGAPNHLDLDGARARAATRAGVTVSIDSDCHRARSLGGQMALGVGTARRGWTEPRHTLNTRSLADVRTFVAAKRAGASG
ncbi:MAG TPA: PHP domain-containing protein [Vicinamibacterales bacterium]|nr:PHP domain-containing protein [Vicinamibacterales bacterium]